MVFSSIFFLLYFLPLFLVSYHLVNARFRNNIILLFSLFFYAWGAPKFIFILLASTIVDFYLVRALYNVEKERSKKWFLFLSIFLNLGLLVYFKYANFFVDNVNGALSVMGISTFEWVKVALPIGISFYTFQTLTYSIDIYRGIREPLKKLEDYLLYILSFPQMIAGPIVRFASIADQIENRAYKVSDRLIGLNRFCIGLAKKVLIANVMGQYADSIIDGDQLNTAYAWIGILAYTFQIYFDFSGYSDMAIGLGRMMGFRFPENFESPYTSRNITEFWGRWHITLGEWMRDYLYIPLGGNRVNTKARLYFNLSFVFLISGLWHGASWNFILWGAFHGLFLILDRLFLMKLLNKLGRPIAIISTFFVTVIGWVFFRIEDYGEAMNYLNEMFSVSSSTVEIVLKKEFWLSFALAILFSFLVYFPLGEKLRAWFFDKNEYSSKQYIYLTALSLALFTLSVSAIANTDFNPFIYFRF